MRKHIRLILATLVVFVSCDSNKSRIDGNWLPCVGTMPSAYWNIVGSDGIDDYMLSESLIGLSALAIEDGVNDVMVWSQESKQTGYVNSINEIKQSGVKCLGDVGVEELALLPADMPGSLRNIYDGYVLIDIEHNPESVSVGAVASHVFRGLIVDIKKKDLFDQAGIEMLYDATQQTVADSWHEFKDKCRNTGLIFNHVGVFLLKNMVIANRWFCININTVYGDPTAPRNWDLFCEVLNWLEPNSPCYGADAGSDEGDLDEIISLYGNHWVPFDWGHNTVMTSLCYKENQGDLKYQPLDPKTIDFSLDKNFISYYMSDGDNCQWLMHSFYDKYYSDPFIDKTKCSFGMACGNLSMISPAQMRFLLEKKRPQSSIFERGSYYFIDKLGQYKDRQAILKQMAEAQAAQMKRNNVVLLGTVTRDKVDSPEAMEGYQAMVDANDNLLGIIAIAYSPYADSDQEIMWVTNKKGIDIPIVMTTYSIWNCQTENHLDEGSPTYIAHKMKRDGKKYNAICIHCWSWFGDTGDSEDELAEFDTKTYPRVSKVECADMCTRRLPDTYTTCNLEELFWRIRMEYRPEQTKAILGL